MPTPFTKQNRFDNPAFAERFWSHVDKTDGCWWWTGGMRGTYGRIYLRGRATAAHRVAYALTYGEIPNDIFVCHHCDNRTCVRPDHLFLGTHQDNMTDRNRKGRTRSGPCPDLVGVYAGEKNPSAKLTGDDVRAIRAAYTRGGTSQETLGKMYGVTQMTIWRIVHHRKWGHIS